MRKCAAAFVVTWLILPRRVGALGVSGNTVTFKERHRHSARLLSTSSNNQWGVVMPDYAILDSQDLLDRPSLLTFLQRPREKAAIPLMAAGTAVSVANLIGNYGHLYLILQSISVVLGFVNSGMDLQSSIPPYDKPPTEAVSPNIRLGVVDDALLNVYSGVYTGCTSWLALRTSPACPSEVIALDCVVGPLALGIFLFSILCPVFTLLYHYNGVLAGPLKNMVGFARQTATSQVPVEPLSDTELLRARGLLAIGIIGCVYTPIVCSFLILGQDWWIRVAASFPSQPLLESTTALFGVYATQASMISHRAGKAGVALFSDLVPAFALVCLLLAVFPCAAALYWLGDEISFVDLYSV